MTQIRSTDEPVGKMAKLMAELYSFMAKEMIVRLGEREGKDALRAAIKNFGEARVRAMHLEASERGLPINLETYLLVRDMPGTAWEKDPDRPIDITYCPMHDMWAELGTQDLGAIYCEIDDVLYRGFNVDFARPLCKTKGDKCCRFIVRSMAEEG